MTNHDITQEQKDAIEIVKDDHALYTSNTFDEIVVDHGMKCQLNAEGNLEATPVDHTFHFEIQEDNSIMVTLEEIFDKGYNMFTTTHHIETDGTIHDL